MENESKSVSAIEEFCAEFKSYWGQLPDKALFFTILAAWLLLFQFLGNSNFGYVETTSIMYWLYNAYVMSHGTEDQGMWIPFLVLVLFWWKRKEIMAVPRRNWSPALLLIGLCLMLHALGYLIQQQRLSVIAFFVGIYAIMGLAWGPAFMRATFFPFFLFSFCLPVTSLGIVDAFTFDLRILVCKIVTAISPLLGVDVIRKGTQIFNVGQTFKYEVAAACSGLRSVIAIFCIGTIYAFMNFDKPWKRIVMMLAAFPLSVLGNTIRMMIIILTAESFGQESGNWVHENAFFSMVPYIPALFGVLLIGHWLREPLQSPNLPLAAKPV